MAGRHSCYRKISPKDKLVIPLFDFGCDVVIGSKSPAQATAFQAIIKLKNLAEFPLAYQVEEIDFRVQNTTAGAQMSGQGSTLDPGQEGEFHSNRVVFHHPVSMPIEGTLHMRLIYGKPGKQRLPKMASLRVFFAEDPTSPGKIIHAWRTL